MAKGVKTGGRTAGTPNKRTVELEAQLEALGCDPVEGIALIALNKKNSAELRGRMFAELLQYKLPKRKAVEQTTVDPWDAMSQEEILEQMRALIAAYPHLKEKFFEPKAPA